MFSVPQRLAAFKTTDFCSSKASSLELLIVSVMAGITIVAITPRITITARSSINVNPFFISFT